MLPNGLQPISKAIVFHGFTRFKPFAGRYFPFYLTRNELLCSEDVPDRFRLYRVFDYSRSPRIYVLEGSMREACDLQATEYLAAPSSPDATQDEEM